jgi:hypothetical protein
MFLGAPVLVAGIIIAIRLSLCFAAVLVDDTGAISSLQRSWEITRGNVWRLLLLGVLVDIPSGMLGFVLHPGTARDLLASFVGATLGTAVSAIAYLQLTGRIVPQSVPGDPVASARGNAAPYRTEF